MLDHCDVLSRNMNIMVPRNIILHNGALKMHCYQNSSNLHRCFVRRTQNVEDIPPSLKLTFNLKKATLRANQK